LQQLRGDCSLPVRCRVDIVEGLEEGVSKGLQLGRSLDVKGAWFEMDPKRLSQAACGFAQLTLACKFATGGPLRTPVAREESATEKFSLDRG
jgi:hypothetical protein